ncbi:MAG: iron ABC transporter permease [[Bacteroides] pectinophilus]|nr:iron ABC transporter permease [[Bacteroides] pectinophilus]
MEKKRIIRYGAAFISLAVLFVIILIASINTGSVHISVMEIINILLKRTGEEAAAYSIIWKIRLPRLLMAAVLGGALALSGYLMQTFFRNPIAGPYVLGISSGAKMVLAVVTIIWSGHIASMPVSLNVLTSFAGSMLCMLFVLFFAGKVKSMATLLVVGVMIGNICSAVTDFMINFANEAQIVNLTHWSLGTFSGASWTNLKAATVLILITFILTFLTAKPMSAYQLGEDYAKSMGINIKIFRIILITLASMLSACVTAFAGPIAFVGIAVPHITKLLFGTAKPIVMIPAVTMCGSIFCMACDLIARTALAPSELSIGTVTSVIGAPIVIWLMVGRKHER